MIGPFESLKKSPIVSVHFHQDHSLVSTNRDGTVFVWDVRRKDAPTMEYGSEETEGGFLSSSCFHSRANL